MSEEMKQFDIHVWVSIYFLVYTGVMEKEIIKEKVTYQNRCLALGDGKTYNKLKQISGNCQLEGIHGRVLDMKVEIDRTYSGMVRDAIAIRKAKIKTSTDKLQLRLILDKYSVEVFLNDGQQVLSSTFYTPIEADGIRFACDGKAVVNIQKYDIVVD